MKKKAKTWKDEARRIARAVSWRKVHAMRRQSEYWRVRWKTQPESMRANLDRLNGERKRKAGERTERLAKLCQLLPDSIPSQELRKELGNLLASQNFPSDRKAVERLLSNLRRRRLISFDMHTLSWMVAK